MAEAEVPLPQEKSVDSQYGYEDEKDKSFVQKMVEFIRSKENKAFKGMKEVT